MSTTTPLRSINIARGSTSVGHCSQTGFAPFFWMLPFPKNTPAAADTSPSNSPSNFSSTEIANNLPPLRRHEPDGGESVLRGESGGVQRDGDGDAHRWNRHVGPGGYPRVPIRETFASLRWSARRVQEIQAGEGYRARPLRRGSLRRAKG